MSLRAMFGPPKRRKLDDGSVSVAAPPAIKSPEANRVSGPVTKEGIYPTIDGGAAIVERFTPIKMDVYGMTAQQVSAMAALRHALGEGTGAPKQCLEQEPSDRSCKPDENLISGFEPRKRVISDRRQGIKLEDDLFSSPIKERGKQVKQDFQQPSAKKVAAKSAPARVRSQDRDAETSRGAQDDDDPDMTQVDEPSALEGSERILGPEQLLALDEEEAPLQLVSECSDLRLQVPKQINFRLRGYQRDGVKFLFRQYSQGMGGVLADDMGLGKTLQTIAFLSAVLGKNGTSADNHPRPVVEGKKRCPILIVCPPTVLDNWRNELDLWGNFLVCMYAGRRKESAADAITYGRSEIMLCGFEAYRTDHAMLNAIPWHVVVFDEAHRLKNVATQLYKACLGMPTKLRYLLTGTVMQNNFEELWSILDYAVPGSLGERKPFVEYYAGPLKHARQISAAEHVIEKGKERQERLHKLLGKYLLRRRKDTTIPDQLPTKTDQIVFCKMTPLQTRAYRRFLTAPELLKLNASFDECTCGSGLRGRECCFKNGGSFIKDAGPLWSLYHDCQCADPYHPLNNPDGCKWHKPEGCKSCPRCLTFPALHALKSISNHLDLVKADIKECGNDKKRLERKIALAEMILGEDAELAGGTVLNNWWRDKLSTKACGKLKVLMELLTVWSQAGSTDKVLLFSMSTKMLDRIEELVLVRGHHYHRLDGSTDRADRQKMVDSFNNDASAFIFMISTLAGGVGLNLASANKVIIMDPSWNPAHDLQAIDRAYRLGSKRDVTVFRFISAGTVEENIYRRQFYKQQQANVVVENMHEPRYFDAVQKEKGMKGENGEIFGLENLLRMAVKQITTLNILQPENNEPLYRIEDADPSQFAVIKREAEHRDMLLDETIDDRGLIELAKDSPKRSHKSNTDSKRGGLKAECLEQLEENADERKAKDEAAILQVTALKAVRHDELMGAKGLEKQNKRTKAQADLLLASLTSPHCPSSGYGAVKLEVEPIHSSKDTKQVKNGALSPVESLAAWQNLSVVEMAKRLYSMTTMDRQHLMSQYIQQH